MKRKFLPDILSKQTNTLKMNCKRIHTDFIQYLEGGLDKESQKKVEDHLSSCSNCSDFVASLKEAFHLLDEEKYVHSDPFMFTRIQARLANTEKNTLNSRFKVAYQTIAITTIILFGVFFGMRIGKEYASQKNINSDYQTEVYYLYDIRNESMESVLLSD